MITNTVLTNYQVSHKKFYSTSLRSTKLLCKKVNTENIADRG